MRRKYYVRFILLAILAISYYGLYKIDNNEHFAPSNKVVSESQSKNNTEFLSPFLETIGFSDELNNYQLNITFDPNNNTYLGFENVKYKNTSSASMKEIYFHLYPNAFKSKTTAPVLYGIEQAYPNGFEPGQLEIREIKVDGQKVDYELSGLGETILKIKLNKKLLLNDSINLSLNFQGIIPPATERFGYNEGFYNFGNWYPIVAMHDKTGWNLDPYYRIGDPFYSDVANYDVILTVPKGYMVAASGELIQQKSMDNKEYYQFVGHSLRDFAWVTSKNLKLKEERVDGVLIKSYYRAEDEELNRKALKTAANSLKTFNKLYGKYPYPTYSVVETNFSGGMEYPGIVFISNKYYNKERANNFLEIVVAHETAHQWWYAVVGNDEVDESWLDESFASYSEVIYFENEYGKEAGERYFELSTNRQYQTINAEISSNQQIILKSVNEFNSWHDYGGLVYGKGAVMLHALRKEVGDETFYKILQQYYDNYTFKIATTENFIQTVEQVTGENWDSFFNHWLYGKEI